MGNPYDELPYRTTAIEWSAPERLALASWLHGGPRVPLGAYRVLELGCANGANLLPLAFYRRQATFVGLDGAASQIAEAERRGSQLGLHNVEFVHGDLSDPTLPIDGKFEFIIAHGVFSWIDDQTRNALLELCASRLQPGGLLYFNYNAKPGWSLRGMVRDFVRAQTSNIEGLRARAEAARAVCERLVAGMERDDEPPYRALMANELRLVRDGHVSYVAHEYLAPDNHAYWRSDLMELLAGYGLEYVADADFNYPWSLEDEDFTAWLRQEGIVGQGLHDTVDLLRYRQLHSPVFTQAPLQRRSLEPVEFERVRMAACLSTTTEFVDGLRTTFDHPSGYEVTVDDRVVYDAFVRLAAEWPGSLRVGELFPDLSVVVMSAEVLHRLEREWGRYRTSSLHTSEAFDDGDAS